MQSAVDDVVAGMSVKKAAQKWSMPRTTLNDIKLGHYKHDEHYKHYKPGPSTILTQAEESLLQEWVVEMSRRGLPLNGDNLLRAFRRLSTRIIGQIRLQTIVQG